MPAFASASELIDRLRQRDKPTADHTLTPDGFEFSNIRDDLAKSNEARIARLQRALQSARERLGSEHSFARLSGHARADFAKSRER